MKGIRKYLAALACAAVLFPTPQAHAQLGEIRRGFAIGGSAGLAMNRIGFDPTIKQFWHLGPTAGITARFTSELYFKALCALQVELNFAQVGWREHVLNYDGYELPDTYSHQMNYVQLPILARLAWGKENGFMVGFCAGPQFSYLLGESSKQGSTWTTDENGNPDRPNGMFAQYSMKADHRFEYGITAGLSGELATSLGRFALEARYFYGLSDIYKNAKKDVFARSNNGTIIVKLSYLFDLKSSK